MFGKKTLIGVALAATALLATTPVTASAHGTHYQPRVTTLSNDVMMPFSLAISKGRIYVADGATARVSKLVNGSLQTVAQGPTPGDVAGLAISKNRRYLAYTSTSEAGTRLFIKGPQGSLVSADLSGYEQRRNPDGDVSYGVDNPSQCVRDALDAIPESPGASYPGIVDSHPYAVAAIGHRSWIVADAGGNDLLKVDSRGRISTLAVLPRQPLKITAAIAETMGLPSCVVGVTYNFEAVPTDVEVGRGGWLYVTTLAGGPEDPSLGARSSVYRVNPYTGKATKIGSGLSGATNLALGRHGEIYVAELFAGQISVLRHGKPVAYVPLAGALSVESSGKTLYAGTIGGETGPGSIVKITTR